MKNASVSEVKARLSHYISIVRRGGEIQILDRGVPVARLVGLRAEAKREPDRTLVRRLVMAEVLTQGNGDTDWILDDEPLDLGADLSSALDDEREESL
jgi:prevent-host-death family protein